MAQRKEGRMKTCEHCGEGAPRRTRCNECNGLLCSFCYQTHQIARAAGDGCLGAFMSAQEKLSVG